MRTSSTQSVSSHPRVGYTLLELVVASVSATVLMGGLASSIYIASQSLAVTTRFNIEEQTAQQALATINRDVQSALSISELTTTAITITVPDRDGDTLPETIRYAWSGTAGDPLTQQYNGGTVTMLAGDVQSLSFNWITRLIEGVSTNPIVLFVSGQAADGDGGLGTPTAAEQDRITVMEGWGYDVTVISQEATQTEMNTALADANVVYVSGVCNGNTLGTKLTGATIGVVTESYLNASNLGFYTFFTPYTGSIATINITNTTHYITSGFTTGNMTIVTTPQDLKFMKTEIAPDAVPLSEVDEAIDFPNMLILDAGDELADASAAAGRRCQVPWGEGGFDISTLNSDGLTLMQRAIEWGAGAGDDTNTDTPSLEYHEFTEAKRSSGNTSLTIDLPTGTAEGDLLIAVVTTDGSQASSLAPPAGWNQIILDQNSATLGVWWKIAGSSEASTYDFTWGGSEEAYGWIMRFSGHDPSSPIHGSASSQSSGSSPATPSVTTTTDGCLILRIGAFDDDDVTIDDAGMADHTTITMDESGGGSGTSSGGAAYEMQTTAGSSGTANFTLTASEGTVTATIAIAPETP